MSPGEFIGDYQILEPLGKNTYHVVSNPLGKEFALKTLQITEELDPEWLGRLEAQTALLNRLVHPNIDTIVNSGRFQDQWLWVKDFICDEEGHSCNLRQYCEKHGGALSPYQVITIARQIADALAFAHSYADDHHNGICHGNLKPENILLAYSAPIEVRLTDFQPYGLMTQRVLVDEYIHFAQKQNHPLLHEQAIASAQKSLYDALHYTAPQQPAKPTPQSDLYSLGVILYQLLTGQLPYGRFPMPTALRQELPSFWDEVITRCLQYRPELRYQSMEELQILLHGNSEPETATPQPQERHSLTPRGMVYIPAAAFLVGSEECGGDALPQHEQNTPGFYIDRTPVTVAQFRAFIKETNYITEAEQAGEAPVWIDGEWKDFPGACWKNPLAQKTPDDFDAHPVTQLTYNDALAYANWLGRRFPTEFEWEYAARGGQHAIRFPWGNVPSRNHANYGSDGTCAVMQYHANGYGLYDMAGNIWEWADSWYQPYPGNTVPNPHFGEKYRVIRGGCWLHDGSHCLITYRNANQPHYAYPTVGFRTVCDFQS